MGFFKTSNEPPISVEIETDVWSCAQQDCNGWMRKEFTLSEEPNCPLCGGEMEEEMRILPEINKNAYLYNRVSYR